MNYTELVAAIVGLIHRTDLNGSIPNFILLAETKMNRFLRVRQMETTLAATPIVDNVITLAADIADVKALWVPGYEGTPLKRQSLDSVLASGLSGTPTQYARRGAQDLFINGGGDVQGVLYTKIPGLTESAPENWLATEAPDVYLYGSLIQCAIFTRSDKTAYEEAYLNAIADLSGNDNRYTGPLVARAR